MLVRARAPARVLVQTTRWRSGSDNWGPLSQRSFNDLAAVVGQPLVAAVVAERQPLVVETEQVQDRGVHVVDVRFVLGGPQADRVGRADYLPAFDPAAG